MKRSMLVAFVLPIVLLSGASEAGAQDMDADGVPDSSDNCVLRANPNQLDPDRDGFGNRCDGDFDQDGDVDDDDFDFFATCGLPICDLCEDGTTGDLCDFGVFGPRDVSPQAFPGSVPFLVDFRRGHRADELISFLAQPITRNPAFGREPKGQTRAISATRPA